MNSSSKLGTRRDWANGCYSTEDSIPPHLADFDPDAFIRAYNGDSEPDNSASAPDDRSGQQELEGDEKASHRGRVSEKPASSWSTAPFPAEPLDLPDPATIPPREWLYGRFLIRRYVSLLSAASGAGKTAYSVGVAASIAANTSLLGDGVYCGGGPVLICGLEDPEDELSRRVAACMLHHDLMREQLYGRLLTVCGRKHRLTIAKLHEDGATIVYPDQEALIARIRRDEVVAVMVDPFVNSHELPENSNEHINAAVRAWAEIADTTGCSVLLIHHTRKGAVAGDPDGSRGASALNSAVRSHLTLSAMSSDEAKSFGIPDRLRRLYVRLDSAKGNLAPPSDKARWFKLAGVPLGNGTEDYPDGDEVQAVELWEPPSAFADASMAEIVAVLERLAEGPDAGEQFAVRSNSGDRWGGHVLIDGLDKSEEDAKKMLASWEKEGVITSEKYRSRTQRKEVRGLQVDAVKLADMRNACSTIGRE